MKKLSFFLMAMLFSVMSFAAESLQVTLDFSKNTTWGFPDGSSAKTTATKTYTNGDYSITLAGGGSGNGHYWNNQGYLMLGKSGATLTLPAFDFNTTKIVVVGRSGASASTLQNIYVGSTAVSTQTKGSAVTNTYAIAEDYQAAGNVYIFKVGSSHNSQIVKIEIYGEEGGEQGEKVDAPKFSVTETNFKEAFDLTISSAEGTTLKYTTDNTDPKTSATAVSVETNTANVAIPAKSTVVKAVAVKGDLMSVVASTIYAYVNSPETAYTVAEAMEVIDAGLGLENELYVKGEISEIEKFDANYGSITYWIKDEEDNKFECYSGLGLNKAKFTSIDDLVVGSKVVVCGTMKKYNTTYEFNYNNYIVSLELPVVNHTITVSANPAEAGTVTGGGEFEETDEITVKAVANDGYEFVNWTENEEEVSTDAEYTFTVLADRALVANFKKAAPATETVYFINTKKWSAVKAHVWGGKAAESAWPGKATVKETEKVAGYDVYSFTANVGDYANIIFNNNNGGSQTPDLVWTAGKYYVIDMGWLTKEEAETKLAAPLPETWNIVGDAGLMGKGWDLNAAENAMTKQGDGTYLLEKKDITITAGTYEYKAAKDHGWTVSVPQDGNQKLTISKSGIYDITFVLNVTAKTLKATTTLKKEAVVIPTVIIAGDMNGWDQNKDKFTMSADSLTATFKTTLAVKNYGFKMIVGGAWLSDGKTITRAANSTKFTGANGENSKLTADIAGDYIFTWEYATKTLTVTYPALPVKYNVTVTAEHGTVTGAGEYEEGKTATLTATPAEGYQFVNWTVGEEVVSTENPYSFVVTADVALVANFELIPPTKYNVTVTATAEGEDVVTGGGEYAAGEEVTVTASEELDGWVFIGWTEDGEFVANDPEYTFVVDGDVELVAVYAIDLGENEVTDLVIDGDNMLLTGSIAGFPMGTMNLELAIGEYDEEEGTYLLTEESKLYVGETNFTFVDGMAAIDMNTNSAMAIIVFEHNGTYYYMTVNMSAATAEPVELVLTDAIVAINEDLGTLTFNVATGEGEGYFVELSGYTAPGVHEGPQICLLETPEAVAFANYVETSVVDGVITLTGEFTSFMGANFDLTISGKLPVVEPEVIAYELNGGEFPAVVVPTNAELWGTDTADVNGFMHYYNHYYGLKRATQTIENVASFAYAQMQQIMTDEASAYKWLGDYVQSVATAAGKPLSTDMAAANESGWRWSVWAFFNACAGKNGSVGIDFTEAGKPEAWGAAYQAAHEVVLPTEPVAEDYVLPTPVKEGYTFVGWYDNAEGTGEAYTVIPAGWAGTLYAIWEVEGPGTALENIAVENIAVEGKAVKAIVNGQLIIIKNGVQYNAQGAVVK